MWALINGVYLSVVLRAFIAGPLVLSYPDLHVLDARVLVTLHNRIIQIMHCFGPDKPVELVKVELIIPIVDKIIKVVV